MRVISLELKNIRSYRHSRIEFPDGITLLAGDIGAGKSTLLVAIEFALFGLSRGELVGSALLRHGAADGAVVLQFSVEKHAYAVTRTLKRSASGVSQDNGWIEKDGVRETLTPSELRARIYEILGYPLQFLGKQRNLLYRFTIYTPQEEMKAILLQSSEERIETIRRIFGIDAYRIARDNAHLLAKALKEREGKHESVLQRLKQDEERLKQRVARQGAIAEQKAALERERERLAKVVEQAQSAVTQSEAERTALQHQQQLQVMQERNRNVAQAELQNFRAEKERKEKGLRERQDSVEKMRTALDLFTKELPPDASQAQEQLAQSQSQLEQLKTEEGKALVMIEQCSHTPSVAAGTQCPTCRQKVTSEHLAQVSELLGAQKTAAQRKHEATSKKIVAHRQLIQSLQGTLERVRQIEDLRRRLAEKEVEVKGYGEDVQRITQLVQAKQESLAQIQVAVDAALPQKLRAAEQKWLEAKSAMQAQSKQLLEAEKQLARIEQEAKDLQEAQTQLSQLTAEEAQLSLSLAKDSQVRQWVTRQFSPFTATVERHVLMSIHSVFDAVFRQWFSRLIEDDGLTTRIDHEFAPVMHQYGYETDVAFLSGGERTAVSLAYRLALVHTIHVLSPHLGTSGIIMLDEPTEGFSSEQLERVRDVLRDLRMEQIILVSHEQQLEGFVDHILRVRKTGDGSVVEITA